MIFTGVLPVAACAIAPALAVAAEAPPGAASAYAAPAHAAPAVRAPAATHSGETGPYTRARAAGHHVRATRDRPADVPPAPHRARPGRSQELADAGQGPMPALATAAAVLFLGGAGLLAAARRLRG